MNRFKNEIENQTPRWLCNFLVSLIGTKKQKVLEPTPGYGNLVRALKEAGHNTKYPKGDFLKMKLEWYDAVVMNPPFRPIELTDAIFKRCMAHTNSIVSLINWDFILNSGSRFKRSFDYGLVKIIYLPRSTLPSVWSRTCVNILLRNYRGDSVFEYFDYRGTKFDSQQRLDLI